MKTILPICLLLTLTTACTTIGEIRQLPIYKSEEVSAPAEALSACVHNNLISRPDAWAITYFNSKDGGTFHLAAGISGGYAGFINWDAAFVPIQINQTLVEIRTKKTVWGGPIYENDYDLWKIIEGCGARQ